MTAKEKAKKLTDKFRIYATSRADEDGYCERTRKEASKQCALICIDEKINSILPFADWDLNSRSIASDDIDELEEVKQEINKL
jgi:hypothetical protein